MRDIAGNVLKLGDEVVCISRVNKKTNYDSTGIVVGIKEFVAHNGTVTERVCVRSDYEVGDYVCDIDSWFNPMHVCKIATWKDED